MEHLTITTDDRLNLKKLMDQNECENNTDTIREVKHSVRIRDDIRTMENLKNSHAELRATNPDAFTQLCQSQCSFLFDYYMDIFAKVLKDELDLLIMTKVLGILKMIEDEKVDQHEGSIIMGKFLKELYLDAAIKRADNLDKEFASVRVAPVEGKTISWKEFISTKKGTNGLEPMQGFN